jgi:hypothetical protein
LGRKAVGELAHNVGPLLLHHEHRKENICAYVYLLAE